MIGKALFPRVSRRSYTRLGAAQVGIVVTGSPARYLELSKSIVHKADRAGVSFLAIGVGPKVDDEELRIVSGSRDSRIFRLDSFDQLEALAGRIALEACSSKSRCSWIWIKRHLQKYIRKRPI